MPGAGVDESSSGAAQWQSDLHTSRMHCLHLPINKMAGSHDAALQQPASLLWDACACALLYT